MLTWPRLPWASPNSHFARDAYLDSNPARNGPKLTQIADVEICFSSSETVRTVSSQASTFSRDANTG